MTSAGTARPPDAPLSRSRQTSTPARYPWPVPPGASSAPVWTDGGFFVDGVPTDVVCYTIGASAWSDDLTVFHEENAGTDHPIDIASRDHALSGLDHVTRENPVVLEIGCSSGYLLPLIRERLPHATVIGADYVLGPLKELAGTVPDVPIIQFDLVNCPLPDQSVDAVIMLNVLEHIKEDVQALHHVFRILRPGGVLILEVPAGPHLYDVYDRLLMHHRRYTMGRIRRMFARSGFEIVKATHSGTMVYPAFAAVKLWNRARPPRIKRQEEQVVAGYIQYTASSLLLGAAFGIERWLGRWVRWPFGIRCVLVGRRPASGR